MTDEIEDLYALADECREWAQTSRDHYQRDEDVRERQCELQFTRLAKKLDDIAKRLADRATA